MTIKKEALAICLCILMASVVVSATLFYTLNMPCTGNIVTVGLSASIVAIQWGDLQPTTAKSVTFTITNTGNKAGAVNMTTLAMPSYLSLTWDAEDKTLQPQETLTVTIQLYAHFGATAGAFSFTILLTIIAP